MKICTKCGESKQDTEFGRSSAVKSGLRTACTKCSNEMQRKYREAHREEIRKASKSYALKRTTENRKLVKDYLLSHPCMDCGERDIIVLEFDHARGKKIAPVTTMVCPWFTEKTIREEIEKCDVVCANCHRRRTYSRRNIWRTK